MIVKIWNFSFLFVNFVVCIIVCCRISISYEKWIAENFALQSFSLCIFFSLWMHIREVKKSVGIVWGETTGETNFEQILHLWIQNNWSFYNIYCIIFFHIDCLWLCLCSTRPVLCFTNRHRNGLSASFYWSSFTSVSIRYPIYAQQIIF